MTIMPIVRLKEKKDRPIAAGHPWIFSNAIQHADTCDVGGLVHVYSSTGAYVGVGMYNPHSAIRVRILSRTTDTINEQYLMRSFKTLDAQKRALLPADTTGYRIAHGDADYLPGLIVDRYADVLVFQIHTAGMDRMRSLIVSALQKTFTPQAIVERSDVDVRLQEGLSDMPVHVHHGKIDGSVDFSECGMRFRADVMDGQKTGFFLDQRSTRCAIRDFAKGRDVMNLFCYSGASSVAAALGGAHSVVSVDVSKYALQQAEEHFNVNGIDSANGRYPLVKADVFTYLKKPSAEVDCIICDPPSFAKSAAKTANALHGYSNLNAACLSRLKPNGILITSSCSGRVTQEMFHEALRFAAGKSGRDVQILGFLGHAPDHTDRIAFPEGRYLKTYILRVL